LTAQRNPLPGLPSQLLELWGQTYGLIRTQALHAAASLGIADLLSEGPLDSTALAEATSCHPESLRRLLRCLVACDVLAKDDAGLFTLTPVGQMLRSDSALPGRSGSIFYGSHFIWDAWGNLLENVRTGKTAFEIAHGAPLFTHLAAHGDDLRIFSDFMNEMAGPRLAAAVQGLGLPATGTVIDVGGGEGSMLITILASRPDLRGVLLELPEVAERAEAEIRAAGLGERCRVLGGSFLDEVPSGGDFYILSNILHDWDDSHCLRILGNCRRAMKPEARLGIIDAVMPEENVPFALAALDLQMMTILGGKQRTEAEYRAIIEPSGLRITEVSPAGRIEAKAT
jgi:hypothetical protein